MFVDNPASQIRNTTGWCICWPTTHSSTYSLQHQTFSDWYSTFPRTRMTLPHIHEERHKFHKKLHTLRYFLWRTQSYIECQNTKRQWTTSDNDSLRHRTHKFLPKPADTSKYIRFHVVLEEVLVHVHDHPNRIVEYMSKNVTDSDCHKHLAEQKR